jgi:hypothetical protein
MKNGEPFGSPFESGRRDLNSTAPMRSHCFWGAYMHELAARVGIGKHGTANITAKVSCDHDRVSAQA